MDEIDQRVVLLVIDAGNNQLLPDQRQPGTKHFFSALRQVDAADLDRSGLAAGDGVIGRILKPVPLAQLIDNAAVEIGHVAGDARNFRIRYGVDQDIVTRPVYADLSHNLGGSGKGSKGQERRTSMRLSCDSEW